MTQVTHSKMTSTLKAFAFAAVLAWPAIGPTKDEAIKRFTDANRQYEAGEAAAQKDSEEAAARLQKAAQEYEAILAAGYHNGQIFFNLGNTYYRLGNVGKAIANYRGAQTRLPRDAAIAANLRQAKLLIQDKEIPRAVPELVSLAFFWYFYLNLDELLIVTLVAYGLLALLLLVHVFWRRPGLRALSAVCGIVFGVLALSLAVKFRQEAMVSRGVVAAKEATVHYGNGSHYSVKFTVHEGADLIVQDEQSDDEGRRWLKGTFFVDLKTADQQETSTAERRSGWLPADAVIKLSLATPTTTSPPTAEPLAESAPLLKRESQNE